MEVLTRTSQMASVFVFSAITVVGCGGQPSASSLPSPSPSTPPVAAQVIDCTKPSSQVATTVCGNTELTGLNQQVSAEYQNALSAPNADRAAVEAAQNTWAQGRDECIKSTDMRACLLQAYRTRLVELKI